MNDSLWNKIKQFLSEKLYITVAPSSTKNRIKKFSIQSYLPIVIIIAVVIIIGVLSFNYYYYRAQYKTTKNNFEEYKASLDVEELQNENKNLKKNLLVLSQNTEELRTTLRQLEQSNQEIKNILGEDSNTDIENNENKIRITSILDYNYNILNQGIPKGGSKLNLYYHETDKLLDRMYSNVEVVEENVTMQEEVQQKLRDNAIEYKDLKESVPSIWPLAEEGGSYISSNFGWRVDPISSQQEYHEGLDIAVWYNTPVLATAPGEVTFVGWNGDYGWSVEIDHGHGYTTYYSHLNEINVSEGEKVVKKQKIALTGNSGKSTGPHLHYEVRVNGVPKNPRKFIGR
ncbi:MAG: peptidoglycan DD-metalloendopeptidase family protein [Halanaerobiales bacterium]